MEDWQTCNGVFDFESSSYAIKNYYNDVLDNGWGPFEDNGNEYKQFEDETKLWLGAKNFEVGMYTDHQLNFMQCSESKPLREYSYCRSAKSESLTSEMYMPFADDVLGQLPSYKSAVSNDALLDSVLPGYMEQQHQQQQDLLQKPQPSHYDHLQIANQHGSSNNLKQVIGNPVMELQSFNANPSPQDMSQDDSLRSIGLEDNFEDTHDLAASLDSSEYSQQNNLAAAASSDALFTSPFLHQDYSSMLGHSNPMLMRQSFEAANHAPQLPITNHQLQQIRGTPQEQTYSVRATKRFSSGSRALSPYDKGNFSGSFALEGTDTDRKKRFNRTRNALESSGLMGITMKTADLLKKNESLEKEILKLKRETETLLQGILLNPANNHIKQKYSLTSYTKR